MSQVIFRVEKLKTIGEIAASKSHQMRERPTANADPTKTNVVLVVPPASENILDAIRACLLPGKKPAKNSVLASDILISASPDYFRPNCPETAGVWELERLEAWRRAMEPWIREKFPHALTVVLHLDEATPHYSITDVPVNERTGRLSHREKYGGDARRGENNKLGWWQTEAHKPVAHLGIERGFPGSLAKHTDIGKFYYAVNASTPGVPKIKTKKPAGPGKEPGVLSRLRDPDGYADWCDKNNAFENAMAQRESEITVRNAAILKLHDQIATKAKIADIAQRQAKSAMDTAKSEAKALVEARKEAERIQDLSLPEILKRTYGATKIGDSKTANETAKFQLPDGREIDVRGDRWVVGNDGTEGVGAINLVMQIDGLKFKPAVRLLSESFEMKTLIASYARHQVEKSEEEVKLIIDTIQLPTPAPVPEKWLKLRKWLQTVNNIPSKLADWLNEKGLLFADANGNAVFPRENGGAFIQGTNHKPGGKSFNRTIGKANCGSYVIAASTDQPAGTFLVSDPVDAVAIFAIKPNSRIVAIGEDLITPSLLKGKLAPDVPIYAAFDNGPTGHAFSEEAIKELGAVRAEPSGEMMSWAQVVKDKPELISGIWLENRVIANEETRTAIPQKGHPPEDVKGLASVNPNVYRP